MRNKLLLIGILLIAVIVLGCTSSKLSPYELANSLNTELPDHDTIDNMIINRQFLETAFPECQTDGFTQGHLTSYLIHNASAGTMEPYETIQPFLVTITVIKFGDELTAQDYFNCNTSRVGKDQGIATVINETGAKTENIGDQTKATEFSLIYEATDHELSGAAVKTRNKNIIFMISVIPTTPGGALQDATTLAKKLNQQII